MIDRISKSKFVKKENIIICTTKSKKDDLLEVIANQCGINLFRGSNNDIIKRFYFANRAYTFKNILLIDGDDPLIFPEHINDVISEIQKESSDCVYTNNLPFGLNIKSITNTALSKVYNSYISNNNDTGFGLYFTNSKILKSKKLNYNNNLGLLNRARLTLDYIEDFNLIERIINDLYAFKNSDYSYKRFQKYIQKNYNLLDINSFRQSENLIRTNNRLDLKYLINNKVHKIKY